MDIFLVGGSVRDRLLGIESQDRDYVVVGATAEQMLGLGYKQVGADFPVFLHPETGDEYALARTERKSGAGYHGFDCVFDPSVTLDEDLMRRDLTINAIAQSPDGTLHDPYEGQKDIERRVLRHVSSSFLEDPVRILRVSRFMARYRSHGFSVAPETMELMTEMVSAGAVDELTPERVWKELSRALMEESPSSFFLTLRECGALKVILPELDCLWGVEQRAEHHPEICTGIHTMMVLDRARGLGADTATTMAALLHDLGKGLTPRSEWPRHIHHEVNGVPLVRNVCNRFKVPSEVRFLSEKVAELHLKSHRLLEARPSSVLKIIEALDGLRKPERVSNFSLACQADSQGRLGMEDKPYPQRDVLTEALDASKNILVTPLLEKAFGGKNVDGKKVGEIIRQERIRAIDKRLQLLGYGRYSDTSSGPTQPENA